MYNSAKPKGGENWKPASHITVKDLDDHLMRWGIDYDDVAIGIYQAWEFPSGNIYSLKPDRASDYRFSIEGRGTHYSGPEWHVVSKKIGYDKEKVHQAHLKVIKMTPAPPLKLFGWFRRKR